MGAGGSREATSVDSGKAAANSKTTSKKTVRGRKPVQLTAEELAVASAELLVNNVVTAAKDVQSTNIKLGQPAQHYEAKTEAIAAAQNKDDVAGAKGNGDLAQRTTKVKQDLLAFITSKASPSRQTGWDAFIKFVRISELVPKALRAEVVAPKFTLQTVSGDDVSLEATLSKGPAVIAFLPGIWSSEFKQYLELLKESYAKIRRANAQLIAIYPGPIDQAANQAIKTINPEFIVAIDTDLKVAKEYSLVFTVPSAISAAFVSDMGSNEGAGLVWQYGPSTEADPQGIIVLNASFVVAPSDGMVSYVHTDGDQHKRPPVMEIINALGWL